MFHLRTITIGMLCCGLVCAGPFAHAEENGAKPGAETPAGGEASAPPPGAQDVPDVVARVGPFEISGAAFQRRLGELWQQRTAAEGMRPPDKELWRDVLEQLLREAYIALLVRRADPEVTDQEVERQLASFKARFKTPEAYTDYLETTGQTGEQVVETLRRQLAYATFYEELVPDRQFSEAQLRETYKHVNKEQVLNRATRTADIAHIAAVADPQDGAALKRAHKRIQKAYARIQDGDSFDDVAREMSEDEQTAPKGGRLLEVTEDILLPAFTAQLRSLEPGEVSEPFRSREGWHILKLIRFNEPGVLPFDKARNILKQAALDKERRQKLEEMLNAIRKELPPELTRTEGAGAEEPEGNEDDGAASQD